MPADEADTALTKSPALDEAGEHDEALATFRAILDHGDTGMHLNIGNTLQLLGRTEEAVTAFADGFAADDFDSGYNLASLLEELGRTAEARRVYEKLVSQSYAPAKIALAWILNAEGERAPAALLLQQTLTDTGTAGDLAAGILGHWMYEHGDRSDELLKHLHRGAASYPTARVDLADLLRTTGDEKSAKALLYSGEDADEAESMLPLANWVWAAGDLVEAERLLLHAAALGDRNSTENLSVLLKEQNRFAEARRWWLKAQRMEPLL